MNVIARTQRLWFRRDRLPWILGAALAAIVCIAAAIGNYVVVKGAAPSAGEHIAEPGLLPSSPVPEPPPFIVRPVAPQSALQINARVPIAAGANPAAASMSYDGRPAEDRRRALSCLTAAIYYEAASEPEAGQRAVAQVVLNRVRHPAFPSTVCGVIYQGSERSTGCQFTFTCDGSLARQPSSAGWRRAQATAAWALAGGIHPEVGLATHYHTQWVVPYWASSLDKAAVIGAHIFYRWRGWWGKPSAFRSSARGSEPDVTLASRAAETEPVDELEASVTTPLGEAPVVLDPSSTGQVERVLLADRESGTLVLDGAPGRAEERVASSTKSLEVKGDRDCSPTQRQAGHMLPAQPAGPQSGRAC